MRVSGFMIPANKVVSCESTATIKEAVDVMVEKKIGALVILQDANTPVGIVTKTDLVEAYQKGVTLEDKVTKVMKTDLQTVKESAPKDDAAKALEHRKNHHAIVVDANDKYVGLISAWDIAAESARDSRAWPWIRSEDGKFHKPTLEETAETPRRQSHVYLDYIDSIRDLGMMDD